MASLNKIALMGLVTRDSSPAILKKGCRIAFGTKPASASSHDSASAAPDIDPDTVLDVEPF